MSFDLVVRQRSRRSWKSCLLSNAMKRMAIGQFWTRRGTDSLDRRTGMELTRLKCADFGVSTLRGQNALENVDVR
jgi:hypothetical protein